MTLSDILDSVRQLSENDKLALIEATARMLRQALDDNGDESVEAVAETAISYVVNEGGLTVSQVVESVEQLSDGEKLAVIEAISQMMQISFFATSRSVSGRQAKTNPKRLKRSVTDDIQPVKASVAAGVAEKNDPLTALLIELKNRPNPPREKMLTRGLFKGLVINEEDFQAAEWHPSDEELTGG